MLSDKPWKLTDFLVVMALLITMLLLAVLSNLLGMRGSAEAQNPAAGFMMATCLYGSVLVLVHFLVQRHRTSWREVFGFNSPRTVSALLMAMGVTLIILPVAWGLGILSTKLMGQFQVEAVPQESVRMLQTGISLGPEIFLALLAIAIAPVTEELLFRGILYPFIKQQGYPKLALLGTSVLFGLLHLNLMTFLPLTFLGLVLAWLYETTDNLTAPILAHSSFNLANFLKAVCEHLSWDWTIVGIGALAGGMVGGVFIVLRQRKRDQN
jgi:membrane protease YdiL (CAAX protease family)